MKKTENKQRKLLFMVVAVGFITILAIIIKPKSQVQLNKKTGDSLVTLIPRPTSPVNITSDTSVWNTYKNESLRKDGFTFKYPPEWVYEDSIFQNGILVLGERNMVNLSPRVKIKVSSVWPEIPLDSHIKDLNLNPQIENISVGSIKAKQLNYSKCESQDCLKVIFKVKNWVYEFDVEDSTKDNNKEVLLKMLETFELNSKLR